jgi:hypothetical protein
VVGAGIAVAMMRFVVTINVTIFVSEIFGFNVMPDFSAGMAMGAICAIKILLNFLRTWK